MKVILGIDIGGSTTKIVGLRDGKLVNPFMAKASDPLTSAYGAFGKYLNDNGLAISDVEKVIITGVGSGFFKDGLYGIPTEKVDEFRCVGLGGRHISGLDDVVVVSMGTGTAIVSVQNGVPEYIGGTGVGGGTILGLSQKMLGVRDFDTIIRLADKGDLSKVDLLIVDELSYLTFNRTKSELLFQVISERSERASVIVSTNLEFSSWTELFENDMMVSALVDRLTYRSHVLDMNIPDGGRFSLNLKGKGEQLK